MVDGPFEHFMVNFSKSYLFKGTIAGFVCLFWLDSSSTHWVDTEWDSPSTESTRNETPHQLSQRGVRLHVNWVNAEDTNIYEDFIIRRWLSWLGVSLCVVSGKVDSHLALTQLTGYENPRQRSHCRMLKNLNKSANSKTLKSLIIWPIQYSVYLTSSKNQNKKTSWKCTLKGTVRRNLRRIKSGIIR
jgi:hypothetical protein